MAGTEAARGGAPSHARRLSPCHEQKSNAKCSLLGKKRDDKIREQGKSEEGAIYGILISHLVPYRQKNTSRPIAVSTVVFYAIGTRMLL